MKDIVIVGAGGFGREVEWLINRINKNRTSPEWNILGFIDDSFTVGKKIGDSYVIGNIDYLNALTNNINVALAIGNASVRKTVRQKLCDDNYIFPNLVDPSVIIGDRIEMGIGNIICAGSILTVDISIGNFNIINLDCTLGHDDILYDFITLYPSVNISGATVIGNYVEIGTGTQIIQGKKITDNVIIGAGAVINKDLIERGTYVGVPAKRIK